MTVMSDKVSDKYPRGNYATERHLNKIRRLILHNTDKGYWPRVLACELWGTYYNTH
mgnify:CR=1 FL=1